MTDPSMTEPVRHVTFTIERRYPAAPARVFAAWSDPQAKQRWFACHDDWGTTEYALDFRIGGREVNRVRPPGGPEHRFEARFHDIRPDRRIVCAYDMYVGATKLSVSLATVEFAADGTGTLLRFTEQAAFLDGYADLGERERGTRLGLDRLEAMLRHETAPI